jgi:MFS family permease
VVGVRNHLVGSAFVVFGFVVAMMGTTLPTPLYPLYNQAFGLAPVLTPVIFATYALGVVATLLFFGYLSDEIGRRPMMLAALGLSAASAVTFLFARGLAPLLVGRVLSGLSAGIASGTATAWLVDLAGRRGKQHATLVAVAANIGGLALGPLAAGLLAGLAPAPLRLPFVVDLALVVPALLGVLVAPQPVVLPNPRIRLRMQSMRVPPEVSDIFPPAATVGVCAFAVAGVFSAVAPEFLGNELGDKSAVRAGLLVFLFFAMAAAGQLTVNRIPKRLGLTVGCLVLIAGLALLAAALAARSAPLLFVSAAVSGLGEGLPVGFGLGAINEKVGDKRGETDSAYFVLLYCGVALPVVGVGFVALAVGMVTAGLLFCGIVGLCVLGVLYTLRRRRPDVRGPVQDRSEHIEAR